MSKLHHAIYLVIIGALVSVIVGLLTPRSTDHSDQPLSHRIVVFPFHSMNSDSDDIAAELTAELIQTLKRTSGIEVVLDSELPPGMRNIGEHHRWPKDQMISLIFEGSVGSRGENVQITVQLVDGSSNSHLWAATYESGPDSISGVITDVEDRILVLASR